MSYYFALAIMFQSVLNYVPPVPSCPTCLRCLPVSRAACLTCLRAFVSLPCACLHFLRALRTFIFYELYVAYAPLFFTSLTCLTCPIFLCALRVFISLFALILLHALSAFIFLHAFIFYIIAFYLCIC